MLYPQNTDKNHEGKEGSLTGDKKCRGLSFISLWSAAELGWIQRQNFRFKLRRFQRVCHARLALRNAAALTYWFHISVQGDVRDYTSAVRAPPPQVTCCSLFALLCFSVCMFLCTYYICMRLRRPQNNTWLMQAHTLRWIDGSHWQCVLVLVMLERKSLILVNLVLMQTSWCSH